MKAMGLSPPFSTTHADATAASASWPWRESTQACMLRRTARSQIARLSARSGASSEARSSASCQRPPSAVWSAAITRSLRKWPSSPLRSASSQLSSMILSVTRGPSVQRKTSAKFTASSTRSGPRPLALCRLSRAPVVVQSAQVTCPAPCHAAVADRVHRVGYADLPVHGDSPLRSLDAGLRVTVADVDCAEAHQSPGSLPGRSVVLQQRARLKHKVTVARVAHLAARAGLPQETPGRRAQVLLLDELTDSDRQSFDGLSVEAATVQHAAPGDQQSGARRVSCRSQLERASVQAFGRRSVQAGRPITRCTHASDGRLDQRVRECRVSCGSREVQRDAEMLGHDFNAVVGVPVQVRMAALLQIPCYGRMSCPL